jgi:hypothetical protein
MFDTKWNDVLFYMYTVDARGCVWADAAYLYLCQFIILAIWFLIYLIRQ